MSLGNAFTHINNAAEPALMEQLKVGGIMVLPVGQSDAVQNLIRVRRTETGFEYDDLKEVRFVPLLEGIAKEN